MFATATLTRPLIAGIAALGIAASAAAPASALGRNEENFLKGVLAAVVVNAIIQHNRRSKAQAAPPQYFVQPAPVPSHPPRHVAPAPVHTPAAAAFAEYSPASKRAIQQRLRAYGYYRGPIDGTWGPGTRAAIEAYARDTGNLAALQSRDGTVRLLNGLLV